MNSNAVGNSSKGGELSMISNTHSVDSRKPDENTRRKNGLELARITRCAGYFRAEKITVASESSGLSKYMDHSCVMVEVSKRNALDDTSQKSESCLSTVIVALPSFFVLVLNVMVFTY